MENLSDIRALVASDLDETLALIKAQIISDIPLAKSIAEHIVESGGKRIRPLLVLLSAKMCGYEGKDHIKLAAIVELLHTATLLHDDVIDESELRRGNPTANHEWGNEACVLVGDLLYARAFQLIASLNNARITQILAKATSEIVEGEVLQLMHCRDASTTEQIYLDIIQRKTGKLFEVACISGPILANLDEEKTRALCNYGLNLGIAFQMLDDAIDYEGDTEKTGKNIGDDLQEGKPSLPIIYLLKQGNEEEKNLVKAALEKPANADIQAIQTAFSAHGAIEYTKKTAKHYLDTALNGLTRFEPSTYNDALQHLAAFCIERDY